MAYNKLPTVDVYGNFFSFFPNFKAIIRTSLQVIYKWVFTGLSLPMLNLSNTFSL